MARVFTKLGKEITIAAKAGGPDPENNPHLRALMQNAKKENMPKENVERAIKRAVEKDFSGYKEMTYEGYGPFGIAIFVETATDNTTRTVANVRSYFNKHGGSLGTSGSLEFLFDHKCVFHINKKDGISLEDLELELIDYVAVVDCGTPLNPNLARVQVEGGLGQGIGMALYEGVDYTPNGYVKQNSFMQYKVPARVDVGKLRVEFESSYEPTGPFGAKTIGEIVINTPSPALAHAVFNATGLWIRELPITSEKIVMGLLEKE